MQTIEILHIAKTQGFVYDARLTKTIEFFNSRGIFSHVVILEDKNQSEQIFNEKYKCSIDKIKLLSRRIFEKNKGYFLKIPEFTFKTFYKIISQKNQRIIWLHENQNYGNLFLIFLFRSIFLRNRIIVWDQHELPHQVFFKYRIHKWFYSIIVKVPDVIIFSNEERRKIVLGAFNKRTETETFVINNYPSEDFLKADKSTIPNDLEDWLHGKPYFLWLGLADHIRNFEQAFLAFLDHASMYKLVIIGRISESANSLMKSKLGTLYQDLIFNRFVKQNEIIRYIDHATLTIILYNDDYVNNKYCEPNRLYLSIVRGLPVVCGNNPTMSSVVGNSEAGIILKDDGKDASNISEAINNVLNNIEFYKANCINNKHNFIWERSISDSGLVEHIKGFFT